MNPYGIDFGTTNSVLATYGTDGVEVLSIDEPPMEWAGMGFDRVLPSVLGLADGRDTTFGWAAKRQEGSKLEAVKRLFATEEFVDIGGRQFSVEEAAALLFGRIRNGSPGVMVERAVVTIPANSRGIARFRTKLTAGLAGIEVAALINEPTAAAMAHSINAKEDKNILVFDWGGGTLDVTVLESIAGVFIERASKGIQRSGGIDLDEAFAAAVMSQLPSPPSWSPGEQAQFRLEVERVKVVLSSQTEAELRLPGDGGYISVSRELFQRSIQPKLDELRRPIDQCLGDLNIASSGIDELVMVGGSSKIPAARSLVSELIGREPAGGCDPMTAVAEGAAIASAILAGQLDKDFFVATEHALGTITVDENGRERFSVLIPRNHMLPARETDNYVPATDGQDSVLVRVIEGDPGVPLDHEDNVVLREWEIPIDSSRPRADASFDMTYEYDAGGILHVTVVDIQTGNEMLRDDLSWGVTRDKAQLVDLARRVRTTIDSGQVADDGTKPPTSRVHDPGIAALIERARKNVIPFVDDDEAKRLSAIVADLEQATGNDQSQCKDTLEAELRKYAYLF